MNGYHYLGPEQERAHRIQQLRKGIQAIFQEEQVSDATGRLVETLAHGLAEYEATGSFVEWDPSLEFYEQPH